MKEDEIVEDEFEMVWGEVIQEVLGISTKEYKKKIEDILNKNTKNQKLK
jgi:hypothetical protein